MLAEVNELVIRYVDREMGEDEARWFEGLLQVHPDLADLVEEHRHLRQALIGAHGPMPVDVNLARIQALLEDAPAQEALAPPVVDASSVPTRPGATALQGRAWTGTGVGVMRWAALAASLVLGVLIDHFAAGPNDARLLRDEHGRLVASGALDRTLTERLASETGTGPVRIGMSFQARGGLCRTFSTAELEGLACRQSGGWAIDMAIRHAPAGPPTEYRLAASSFSPALMARVDGLILGEPLSKAAEEQARARGW